MSSKLYMPSYNWYKKPLRINKPYNFINEDANIIFRLLWSCNEDYKLNRLLSETFHIFSADPKSIYRQAIKYIANDISNKFFDNNIKFEYIFNQELDYYNELRCKPFIYDTIFNGFELLKKLQVFVTVSSDNDGMAIVVPKTIENNWLISKFSPSYKRNNDTIEVASVLIYVSSKTWTYKNKRQLHHIIEEVLTHELIHILDSLWNYKYIENNDETNQIREEIELLYPNIQSDDINRLFNLSDYTPETFAWLVTQCLYYTADTEIHAHLNSLVWNIKNSNEQIKDIDFYLRKVWHEYNNIITIYKFLKDIINYLGKLFDYIDSDVLIILNIIKHTTGKQYDIKKFLKQWYKKIKQLIKKCQNIAYVFA